MNNSYFTEKFRGGLIPANIDENTIQTRDCNMVLTKFAS